MGSDMKRKIPAASKRAATLAAEAPQSIAGRAWLIRGRNLCDRYEFTSQPKSIVITRKNFPHREPPAMLLRAVLLALVVLPGAGCGTSPVPSAAGRDTLGLQVYSIGGERLGALEALANSSCPGVTRPYVKSVGGAGDNSSLTYTCE
jgi:hypothetical protein